VHARCAELMRNLGSAIRGFGLSDSSSNQSQNAYDASAEAADTDASSTASGSRSAAVLASNRAHDLMLSPAVPPRLNNPIGMICVLDHSLFARLVCV
jgi:hypothetical protein